MSHQRRKRATKQPTLEVKEPQVDKAIVTTASQLAKFYSKIAGLAETSAGYFVSLSTLSFGDRDTRMTKLSKISKEATALMEEARQLAHGEVSINAGEDPLKTLRDKFNKFCQDRKNELKSYREELYKPSGFQLFRSQQLPTKEREEAKALYLTTGQPTDTKSDEIEEKLQAKLKVGSKLEHIYIKCITSINKEIDIEPLAAIEKIKTELPLLSEKFKEVFANIDIEEKDNIGKITFDLSELDATHSRYILAELQAIIPKEIASYIYNGDDKTIIINVENPEFAQINKQIFETMDLASNQHRLTM